MIVFLKNAVKAGLILLALVYLVFISVPNTFIGSVEKEQWAQTFKGYDCTDDCSGHEAGYEWAEKKGITDPDDCGGNSYSFIEGCRAYAEENW